MIPLVLLMMVEFATLMFPKVNSALPPSAAELALSVLCVTVITPSLKMPLPARRRVAVDIDAIQGQRLRAVNAAATVAGRRARRRVAEDLAAADGGAPA